MEFAHRGIDVHFERSADLDDPATYRLMLEEAGVAAPLSDLHDSGLAQAV